MGMDRDFPMTATQAKVLLVGLVVMGGFGIALFSGAIPGLKPNYAASNIVVLNGTRYDTTTVSLPSPFFPQNQTLPQSFPFHNVTFELWLTNWWKLSGGQVHGNGTEENGTVYSFVLGESTSPPADTRLFVSPDRAFAVYWEGGLLAGTGVELMVRA